MRRDMEASGALREIVEATVDFLRSSPAPKTVIEFPRERRAMYARELLNHFAADAGVAADLLQLYSHYKRWLEDALAMRASWDGEHQHLEDALWLGIARSMTSTRSWRLATMRAPRISR